MSSRKWLIPMAALLTLAIGSRAPAAKPYLNQPFLTLLPNITADGKVDTINLGLEATGTLKGFKNRKGEVTLEIDATGPVTNASRKNFKTKNVADLDIDEHVFGPDSVVTYFQYSVSKTGKAVLKATVDTGITLP